jgi:hypothetical protein
MPAHGYAGARNPYVTFLFGHYLKGLGFVSWITLSPKAYRTWQNLLATHFHGDGFIVDIISRSAVRYREGSHAITLSTEPLQTKGKKKAEWMLAVYLHRPLRWDEDSQSVGGEVREELIVSRIELALKSKVGRYKFVREAI